MEATDTLLRTGEELRGSKAGTEQMEKWKETNAAQGRQEKAAPWRPPQQPGGLEGPQVAS